MVEEPHYYKIFYIWQTAPENYFCYLDLLWNVRHDIHFGTEQKGISRDFAWERPKNVLVVIKGLTLTLVNPKECH